MTPKEMLEKRAKLIEQARSIMKVAEAETRVPSAEERQNFDKCMADARDLKADADRIVALEASEKEMRESQGRQTELELADKGQREEEERAEKPKVIELRKSVCGDTRQVLCPVETNNDEFRKAFRNFLITGTASPILEKRALQKDSDIAGGYLSASEQFMAELIQAVDNLVHMRRIARVLPPLTTADSLGAPSLDNDPADPTWTAEIAIGSEDSTMSFGKRTLSPHPLAQFIKVSKTLIRRSTLNAESIVRERLAYKIGVVMENAYLNGGGGLEPLGIFTASNDGISTGRDYSTGNATTEIRFDGLIGCKYNLKPAYRSVAQWFFHTDALSQISKLKDGEGRYLWRESVQIGEPDRLLNLPYNESQYAPNTFTTGLYVGILGDFRNYWIVDALTMTIQVLIELYAATNQNGYLSRLESDGMPVLEEAFSRVTLA